MFRFAVILIFVPCLLWSDSPGDKRVAIDADVWETIHEFAPLRVTEQVEAVRLTSEIREAQIADFHIEVVHWETNACNVRIDYRPERTSLQKRFGQFLLVPGDAPAIINPQTTLRGDPVVFVGRALADDSGLKEVVVVCAAADLVDDLIRANVKDRRPISVLLHTETIDLRWLASLHQLYRLYNDIGDGLVIVVQTRKVLQGAVSPMSVMVRLAADAATGGTTDFLLDQAVERYGKLHLLRLETYCTLCERKYVHRHVSVGDPLVCSGCGAETKITLRSEGQDP